MAASKGIQTSFNSGVLDPRASSRIDIRQFYNGMKRGENVLTFPLGGVKRRPGTKYLETLPQQLTRWTEMTITAANGGTTANANDNDESTLLTTTTNISTTNPYVVVHYDLLAPQTMKFADVVGISLTAGSSTQFAVQYSTDNTNWTTLGAALESVTTTASTYRRRVNVQARYWRIARVGATDLSTAKVNLQEFHLWYESGTLSAVRLMPFAFNTEQTYLLALTDRNVAVFKDGVRIADVRSPWLSQDLATIDYAQSADTIIAVHEDYAPRRLVRGTNEAVWTISLVPFTGVPQYDYADAGSPTPTSAVQVITFSAGWVQGDTFQFELDGARSGEIVYSGDTGATDQAATAENIRRAVQDLWVVPAFTGVSVARTGALQYTITWAGGSAKAYKLGSVVPLVRSVTTALATVANSVTGVARTEDVWSATRGYPRTVVFFEGRLWFGGSYSLPQSYFASVVNDPFNFAVGEGLDDDAIFGTMNTNQLNAFVAMHSGRDLLIFTTGGEFRFPESPITPSNARPVNQTDNGSAPIKPVGIDNTVFFVQRTRKVLRNFTFQDVVDAYSSEPVSKLASHLLSTVQRIAAWGGSETSENNYIFVVNGDGTVAVFNTLAADEIAGWTIWSTAGTFLDVGVVEEDRYCAVQRDINGTDYVMLEEISDDFYLDCAVQVTNSPAGTSVTGLDHLNGEECRVRADGLTLSNVTPSGGAATIERASEEVEIGLDWNPLVETMPLNQNPGSGDNLMSKRRVKHVSISVFETLGLRMNGVPIRDRRFDINNFDEAPEPVTGIVDVEESTNWDRGLKTVTFDQVDPMPWHILATEIQMESS